MHLCITFVFYYFQVGFSSQYPQHAPTVTCVTPIYHPNIDVHSGEGNVCVSLLNEWTETNSLDDLVQALLFLMYNPNVDDPLSELTSDITQDDFEKTVKAIYVEGNNPFTDGNREENDDDDDYDLHQAYVKEDYFQPALSQFKEKSREDWEKTMAERNIEWDKAMEEEAFAEKLQKWEEEEKVRIEEEKKKQDELRRQEEEAEQQRKEEEEQRQKEEEQRQKEEEQRQKEEEQRQKEEEQRQKEEEQRNQEEEAKEEEELNSADNHVPHPEAQVYNLSSKIFHTIRSAVISIVTCGKTDCNSEVDTGMQNNETDPLIGPIAASNPLNLEQNGVSPSRQEEPAGQLSGLDTLARNTRRLSFANQGSQRPAFKRCISC